MIASDFNQSLGRQTASRDEFLRVRERDHIIGAAVQNHALGWDRIGTPPILPSRAEQNQLRIPDVDVHRDRATARASHDNHRLVLIELSLASCNSRVKVIIIEYRVDHFVAVVN